MTKNCRTPLRAEGVSSHVLGDQLLVFSEPKQTLFSLNCSAAFVWLCLEADRNVEETAGAVAEAFNIGVEQAVSDVNAIIAEWQEAGLVDSTDGLPAAPTDTEGEGSEFPKLEPYDGILPDRFHSEFHFRLAGTTFRVRCALEEYERQLRPVIAHLETEAGVHDVSLDVFKEDPDHMVVREGLIAGACRSPEQIAPILSQEALRQAYRRINYLIAVHGAVVHDGSECVILSGPSGIGKTTLTAALINRGLGYYTDEVAVLHRESRFVLPLPAGLRIKESAWRVISQLYPDFEDLPVYRLSDRTGLRYVRPPVRALRSGDDAGLPARALIFPRYAPGTGTAIRDLDRVEALHKLQDAGYEAGDRLDGERIGELLEWIAGVECYEMTVASLDEAVPIIRGILG